MFKLEGKVALVTGGGRGIGKYIATGLAEAGANVVLTSRKARNLETTAGELERAFKIKAIPIPGNLEKQEELKQVVEKTVNQFGRIDILVNNAGYTWGAPTLEFPLERWDQVFSINVRGVWILTQLVANIMKNQGGGNIINISSIAGFRGSAEESLPAVPYNSSKAAVNVLTMNLAVKLARYKIRVNAIAPGLFRSDMMAYLEKPEFKAAYETTTSKIPLGRIGGEDDIKAAAVFLASAASAFITGHVLVVDGGSMA